MKQKAVFSFPLTRQTLEINSRKAGVGPSSCRDRFFGGFVLIALKTRYQSEAKRTLFSTLNIYTCISNICCEQMDLDCTPLCEACYSVICPI